MIRSKQTTKGLGRFDRSIHAGCKIHWHGQFVSSALMIPFCVILRDKNACGTARRGLAKDNIVVKTLALQRSEKQLQVRTRIRASR